MTHPSPKLPHARGRRRVGACGRGARAAGGDWVGKGDARSRPETSERVRVARARSAGGSRGGGDGARTRPEDGSAARTRPEAPRGDLSPLPHSLWGLGGGGGQLSVVDNFSTAPICSINSGLRHTQPARRAADRRRRQRSAGVALKGLSRGHTPPRSGGLSVGCAAGSRSPRRALAERPLGAIDGAP